MKRLNKLLLGVAILFSNMLMAQTYSKGDVKVAVLNIESKELLQDAESIGKLARLKLQKMPGYMVYREHDVKELFKESRDQYSHCYSVKCLTEVGKQLGADRMLSGSAERFGERIVINLIMVDVESEEIIASDVTEYYNLGSEMEGMIEISVNNLLGVESDPQLVNALIRKENTLSDQIVERLSLNGPRMGIAYVYGLRGQRLQDPARENGYDMLPFMSQFGYQFEWQYLSAGDLQALVEFLPIISGMDQQMFLPSLTIMNGFRHSRTGIEIGFGPTFRVVREAEGWYDENNVWRRTSVYEYDEDLKGEYKSEIHRNIDSKGRAQLGYSFTLAAGKTFQSGHLNIPVNVYYSPGKHGGLVGASFGFNIRRK